MSYTRVDNQSPRTMRAQTCTRGWRGSVEMCGHQIRTRLSHVRRQNMNETTLVHDSVVISMGCSFSRALVGNSVKVCVLYFMHIMSSRQKLYPLLEYIVLSFSFHFANCDRNHCPIFSSCVYLHIDVAFDNKSNQNQWSSNGIDWSNTSHSPGNKFHWIGLENQSSDINDVHRNPATGQAH